ncbi:MAG: hypothetical protein IPL76_10050 [Gemmatimonadetes bacterium]|nr:hypothetical protein [Gemmatimonadota bacterium]
MQQLALLQRGAELLLGGHAGAFGGDPARCSVASWVSSSSRALSRAVAAA